MQPLPIDPNTTETLLELIREANLDPEEGETQSNVLTIEPIVEPPPAGGESVLAELLRETGDVDRALEVLTSATELEPLCEDLYRRIINIHIAAGRRSDGEATYKRLATLLAQELGEEPYSETETLMQEIRKSPRGRPELVKEPL